jgi:hypothetical protein
MDSGDKTANISPVDRGDLLAIVFLDGDLLAGDRLTLAGDFLAAPAGLVYLLDGDLAMDRVVLYGLPYFLINLSWVSLPLVICLLVSGLTVGLDINRRLFSANEVLMF